MKTFALPLIAVALQACVPSLDTIEADPGETVQVEPGLRQEPVTEGEPGGEGLPPADPGPGPDTGPGPEPKPEPAVPSGNGEPPDPGMVIPPPSSSSLALEAVTPAALLDVPVDAPLRITFAEAIDPASSSTFTLQLTRAGSEPVAGEIVLEGNGVAFRPAQGLALANAYTLVLEGTVRSASGAQWTGRQEASFETREGTWIAPQLLAESGELPRIGLDDAGNALAIWNELGSTLSGAARLGMAQYTLSGGWQSLPPASTACGPLCEPKFVAGGNDGDFQISWQSESSLHWQVYHRDAGFEELEQVSVRGTDDAVGTFVDGQPWFAMNINQGVYVRGAGSAPEAYITDSGLTRGGPVLVVDRSQSARVFWAEGVNLLQLAPGAGARPAVMASWGANEVIASITGSSVPSGDALLAWETRYTPTTEGSIGFSSLGSMFVGSDGVTLDRDEPTVPEAGIGNQMSPATSLNQHGDALLGWLHSDGDPTDPLLPADVWMAYRSGTSRTWSAALPLSLERAGSAHPPAVGVDASGNGHGIWVETNAAGDSEIFGVRLRAGTLSGYRFAISRDIPVLPAASKNKLSGDDNCRLVVDAAGRALALWVGATGEVWAARFE